MPRFQLSFWQFRVSWCVRRVGRRKQLHPHRLLLSLALPADMQRPLYMRPKDALEYGLIDTIIEPDREKEVRAAS